MRISTRFVLFLLFLSISILLQAKKAEDVHWSKDGKSFYVLENNSIVRYQLPGFNKQVISEPDALILRQSNTPIKVKSFSFSEDEKQVLIYTNSKKVWRKETRGDYWLLNIVDKTLRQLGTSRPPSSLMFAKISPDGTKAAYVSGHNIFVEDLSGGKITQLTKDGTDRLINGTFDWAYEEEFDCRDGFRWSPDSKNIAYWQIDATKIKNFLLINNTDSLYSYTIPVEYPKVGQDPSPAKIGVVNISTAKTKWIDLPGDPVQHYIPRMEWAANSREIVLEQLNRKQNEAKIFLCAVENATSKCIYSENDKAWIDVKARWSEDPTGWEWIKGGKQFLWVSEKDGWRHIYSVGRDGKEEKITKGNYDVISVEGIDETNGIIYIMASPDNATQQYLYKVSLSGRSELQLVSPASQRGTHSYDISPGAFYAIHSFSNIKNEFFSDWISLPTGSTIKVLEKSDPRSDLTAPQMFQITTGDNVTMDGWMIKPLNFDSSKKYSVLFYVYTEPASTTVQDAAGTAGTSLYAGDIAADGYIQISLDGRGTPAPKGADWRKAIYRKVGVINVRDQAMAAKEIIKWAFVDSTRIAVWGWSGGGSTTLNLLFQYPDIYRTGIAIAPVANRLLYDNIYEERYMGLPKENMQDYINASPISHAKNLRGNLLVIHGTGDDNVHYQGTEMLVNELVRYNKYFEMMSYPNRTHSISEGEGTRNHLSKMFTRYLREHCPPGGK